MLPPMKGLFESEKFESEKFAFRVAGVFTGVCVEDNACSTNPTHTTNVVQVSSIMQPSSNWVRVKKN